MLKKLASKLALPLARREPGDVRRGARHNEGGDRRPHRKGLLPPHEVWTPIELTEEWRELAKTDSDFDAIRDEPAIEELVGSRERRIDCIAIRAGGRADKAVRVIDSAGGFDRLAEAWDRAVMASPAPAPSLLYGWLSASIGNLPPGAELAIMVSGDEDHVAAGLPLVIQRRGPLRVARVLGGERTSHGDVVGADGPAMAGLLAALGDVPCDVLIVKDVLAASRLARGGGFRLFPHDKAPLLRLDDGFAAVVADRLTARDRSDIRRRQRRLAELGELSYDVAVTPHDVSLALDDVFRLHDLRWAGRTDDSSDLRTAADRAFQRAMCPAIARSGRFVVYRLCVDGVAIAFASMFLMGDRAFAYRISFDPAFAKFGPARLLTHHVFPELSDRGVREIELMGGDSQLKCELTDTKLILYSGVRRGSGRLGVLAAPTTAGTYAARAWLRQFKVARAIHRRLVAVRRRLRSSDPET